MIALFAGFCSHCETSSKIPFLLPIVIPQKQDNKQRPILWPKVKRILFSDHSGLKSRQKCNSRKLFLFALKVTIQPLETHIIIWYVYDQIFRFLFHRELLSLVFLYRGNFTSSTTVSRQSCVTFLEYFRGKSFCSFNTLKVLKLSSTIQSSRKIDE